jgi:type II secretory ATPase GspE/PulE/Tfp pilus assembly ATPase PilB-like protein
VLAINTSIRTLIARRAGSDAIYDYVRENKRLKNLQTSLIKLVLERKTSFEELLKLTYFVE